VEDPATGHRSCTWRILVGRAVADIYICEAETGGEWKASLHNDRGNRRVAMTSEAAHRKDVPRVVLTEQQRLEPGDAIVDVGGDLSDALMASAPLAGPGHHPGSVRWGRALAVAGALALAVFGMAGFGQPQMTAPPGYTTLVFDDPFAGSSLSAANWNDCGAWGTGGPGGCGVTNQATHDTFFSTAQLSVKDGLSIGLRNDATAGYSTEGGYAFSVPTFSGTFFVQVRAAMEDTRVGQWPGIWLLPTNGGGCSEIDMHEGGFLNNETGAPAGTPVNNAYAPNYHAPGCSVSVSMQPGFAWHTDLTGFNTYGMELNTATQSVKFFLNGTLAATESGNVQAGLTWRVILWNAAASSGAQGYHTFSAGGVAAGDNVMNVTEVQVWR